jgi:hypothetical protein
MAQNNPCLSDMSYQCVRGHLRVVQEAHPAAFTGMPRRQASRARWPVTKLVANHFPVQMLRAEGKINQFDVSIFSEDKNRKSDDDLVPVLSEEARRCNPLQQKTNQL